MLTKIIIHAMPWEVDYLLNIYTQLKRSKYYLQDTDNIIIETALNLSSYIIDWNGSKLPKQFFIDKYNHISHLLNDYKHNNLIYEGDELYGHLDLQRSAMQVDVTHYLAITPDVYFPETLINTIIQSAQVLESREFAETPYVIIPEIAKMWDPSWDIITNKHFQHIPHENHHKAFDVHDLDIINIINKEDYRLEQLTAFKYAGWFDLYSKSFYEKIVGFDEYAVGYGCWDSYGMIISSRLRMLGFNINQFILRGVMAHEYARGCMCKPDQNVIGLVNYYKDYLLIKKQNLSKYSETVEQRALLKVQEIIKEHETR